MPSLSAVRRPLGLVVAGGAIAAAVAFVPGTGAAAPAHATKLVGTFHFTAGKSVGKSVTGSYFRMITSGGGYFANGSSKAKNPTYTLLAPGTNGGLETGTYQPEPSPAFNSGGGSLANRIIKPVHFEGVNFSAATAKTDPQLHSHDSAPVITVTGHTLHGNVSAFAAAWNKQQFNQGSPKPNGTRPGSTTALAGTYNPKTGHYTMQWKSTIVGGPFNGFTGLWHFTGTFTRR